MTRDTREDKTLTSSVTRILVVDDHPLVRHGLVQLLAREPDQQVVAEAGNADDAMRILAEDEVDLLVLDLSLDGIDGLELIKNIKALHESLPILVVSTHDERYYAQRALHAGALGYLSKDAAIECVADAVRRVRAGKVYLSEEMSERLLHQMIENGEEVHASPIDRLSDRELEVFRGIGRGLATRQVATSLNLSVKTIETYRENIKAKLGLQNANELVRHAVQWSLEDA